VDYLLKPLAGARLFTAISRLKARLGQAPAQLGGVLDQLGARPAATAPSAARAPLRWINASVGQTLRLITVDEVMFFQSDNKYTRLALKDGEALIRKPLKELIDELDPQQFWQIHRSTLVNVNAIASVSRDFRGRMQIKLKHGSEMLLVAESCAHLFRQM
jgi:DNA-binding LytR/AlgR family response regulator